MNVVCNVCCIVCNVWQLLRREMQQVPVKMLIVPFPHNLKRRRSIIKQSLKMARTSSNQHTHRTRRSAFMEACLRIFCLFNLRHLSSSSAYQPENINHHKTAARRGSSSSELQLAASAAAVRLSMEGSSSALHEMPLASVPESENPQASVRSSTIQDASDHVLPEWDLLSESVKQELQKMLSYKTVSTYDYPFIFRLDKLTQGHSLLFMSWAIVASPYSQPVLNNNNNVTAAL